MSKRIRTNHLACLVWLRAVFGTCPAQTTVDFSALERSIADEMKAQNVPDAQVAVISGDRVVWQKGFGVANAETREPVTTDTRFRLGSTTKMFVAAAAVALALER